MTNRYVSLLCGGPNLLLLALLSFGNHAFKNAVPIIAPYLFIYLHWGPSYYVQLLNAESLASLLTPLVLGPILQCHNISIVALGGLVVSSISMLAVAVAFHAQSFPLACVSFFCFGGGSAVVVMVQRLFIVYYSGNGNDVGSSFEPTSLTVDQAASDGELELQPLLSGHGRPHVPQVSGVTQVDSVTLRQAADTAQAQPAHHHTLLGHETFAVGCYVSIANTAKVFGKNIVAPLLV